VRTIEDDNDAGFAMKRVPGRFYISRSFPYEGTGPDDPLRGRASRFAYTVTDNEGETAFFGDGGWEVVLRETPVTRQQLKAIFFEDDRGIPVITFQRFTAEGRRVERESFSLRDDEIHQLETFLALIRPTGLLLDSETKEDRIRVMPEMAKQILSSQSSIESLVRENPEVIATILRTDVTAPDIVALARRRAVLDQFHRLLTDSDYFDAESARFHGPERVWQNFIETNPWVVGSAVAPQFLHSWSPERLEQAVKGRSLAGPGRRADAVLRTAGALSAVVLVEIKHHRTDLLDAEYRTDCWSVGREVAGGIAQCQATADEAQETLGTILDVRDADGYSVEEAFLCRPRTVLIVGSLTEFVRDGDVHRRQFESFERFRRGLRDPEILTFDELFERARLVVDLADADAAAS
jgi:Domain of unknown function (DUF4263)